MNRALLGPRSQLALPFLVHHVLFNIFLPLSHLNIHLSIPRVSGAQTIFIFFGMKLLHYCCIENLAGIPILHCRQHITVKNSINQAVTCENSKKARYCNKPQVTTQGKKGFELDPAMLRYNTTIIHHKVRPRVPFYDN